MPITYLPRTVHLTKNARFLLPFGWTNCPATFISFINNLDSQWKSLATKLGVSIDNDTNIRIIVDDIVSHSKDMETSLLYMECKLCTCLAYHLSISLKKNFIFPQRFEFVGMMYAQMVTAHHSPSMNSFQHGRIRKLFAT